MGTADPMIGRGCLSSYRGTDPAMAPLHRDNRGLRRAMVERLSRGFIQQVADFVAGHERIYVVEQNRDAQMLQLLRMELADRPELLAKLRSVLHYSGLPIDARFVTNQIIGQERGTTETRS